MIRQTLEEREVSALRSRHPQLPEVYFDYLQATGWGEAKSGRMIYKAPMQAAEVYGEQPKLLSVLLLGDDFQGYCLGFDTASNTWLDIDPRGEASPLEFESAFADFVV